MSPPFSTDGSYTFLGERRPAVDGQTLDVISPVDGSLVGRVHEFTAQEIDAVYASGRTARGPDHFPFLGTKASGMGTQGVRFFIEAMTRLKSTVFNMRPMDLSTLQ
jgi:acyl-CoA reductase-like NAD-dependent aldehyde dehydrogenase